VANASLLLNLGCGANPMPGAVNADIRALPGVDVVADASRLPFADCVFAEVHAINPHGFQPVSLETARVMQPDGLLYVTATVRNPQGRPLTPAQAHALGFELIQTAPMILFHQFGIQRTNKGRKLNPQTSTTTSYRRLP
jgi:hypothetical protein